MRRLQGAVLGTPLYNSLTCTTQVLSPGRRNRVSSTSFASVHRPARAAVAASASPLGEVQFLRPHKQSVVCCADDHLAKPAAKTAGRVKRPDGGDGGQGGDVVLEASDRVKGLSGLNHLHKAGAGGNGRKQKAAGSRGRDCTVQVPAGTIVYLPRPKPQEPCYQDSSELETDAWPEADAQEEQQSSEELQKQSLGDEVADLAVSGQNFVLAWGGQGGKGNAKLSISDRRQSIGVAGSPGQRVDAILEVRTIADIGLVGAPNAGKSSLLRALSAASPKVAPYPFTTLQPHLGSVRTETLEERSLVVADIPGLIEGAARNRGLGHAFLRHISRAKALAFVLDASKGSEDGSGPKPGEQFDALMTELRLYSSSLAEKPALVVANKMDLVREQESVLAALEERSGMQVVPTSAIKGPAGLGRLVGELERLLLAVTDDGIHA